MELLVDVAIVAMGVSLVGPALLFVLYPLSLWIASRILPLRRTSATARCPSLSLVVVVRNAEALIEAKLRNCLALDYPHDQLLVVVSSDGSTDRTEEILRELRDPRVIVLTSEKHQGKISALNAAVQQCSGEIVVFSDADATLAPDALRQMIRHYADSSVGGVCGRRIIRGDQADLRDAQSDYVQLDSWVKKLESRVGSVTSNDGKIYSIRRELFRSIEPAVTDDLYVSLNVVAQKRRFLFEPAARAFIRVPSRSASHELVRRRRIVSQGLRGIFLMRQVLNPFRHGAFAIGLTINKVVRRCLPLSLILFLVSTTIAALEHRWAAVLVLAQLGFYALALSYPLALRHRRGGPLRRLASVAYYFCVGNLGTLLGMIDFLRGRQVTKWDPVKTDAQAV